jgi:hypothetical protein
VRLNKYKKPAKLKSFKSWHNKGDQPIAWIEVSIQDVSFGVHQWKELTHKAFPSKNFRRKNR